MDIFSNIEQYISEYSDKEDEVLCELTRETHLKILNPRMLSGNIQGKLLEILSKIICPYQILEIGTYTGYSSICLARGLQPGGTLHTIEINDELEAIALKYFKKAKLDNRIVQYIGNAIEVISEINVLFDLVYIDGDKEEYCMYYNGVFDKVKAGGIILADNVLWSGKVINTIEHDPQTEGIRKFNTLIKIDKRIEKVILPFRDGITLIRKK